MRLRIALTGATGFTGGFILPQLLAAGHEVTALARKPELLAGRASAVVAGDLNHEAALAQLVSGAETVLHVAGAVAAPSRADYFATNLGGTQRLLAAAKKAGVRRFVYVSSLAAREPGLSHYGASKAAAEAFLQPLAGDGFSILILRPGGIYGPGDKATLPLLKALQAGTAFLPGKRQNRFSLIHVADFAAVMAEAAAPGRDGIYELADDAAGHDWGDLAAAARGAMGLPKRTVFVPGALLKPFARPLGFNDAQHVDFICHPDWVAKGPIWPIARPINLGEGLKQTFEWYWDKGWLKRPAAAARGAP